MIGKRQQNHYHDAFGILQKIFRLNAAVQLNKKVQMRITMTNKKEENASWAHHVRTHVAQPNETNGTVHSAAKQPHSRQIPSSGPHYEE